MTAEKKYFICRNENCKSETNYSGELVNGGSIIEYKALSKNKSFICKHCKSEYKEEGGDILLVWGEKEKVIESGEEYKNFLNQYETNRIHFKKLALKNIYESDYKGKNLSFTKCVIDELIIENVNITASFFPILFSECSIGKIRISNSNIIKANRNNYKSLWNFFGINFFKSEIKEAFNVDKCEASIVISDCQVKCPINILKESKVELALIHNKKYPKIITDKGSVVNPLFEVTGRDPSVLEKEIKTTGKVIQDINIEELHVDPDTRQISIFENCIIRRLIFESGSSIKGKLLFKNCIIKNIHNEPYCFEQDLVFLSCTFKNDLLITRSNFKQSLIFELCTFEAQSIFNDIKIEEDFYLSYSAFKKGLVISGIRCGGYIKCQINTFLKEINFEDNVIGRDVIFRSIHSENTIIFSHNEIKAYLILRQITVNGNIDINMLIADTLTIDNIAVKGSFELGSTTLSDDLNISRMDTKGSVSITFTRLSGLFRLERSSCEDTFNACFFESRVNIIDNVDFKAGSTFDSCTFSQQTFSSRNIFRGPLNWGTMHVHNISFNNNYLLEGCTIDTTEARNITIDNNFAEQGVKINNTKANDISINDNFTKQNFEIKDTKAYDFAINNNYAKQSFEIKDLKANNLSFNDNKIKNGFSLENSELNDIKLYDNLINEDLIINNSETDDIYLGRNQVKKELFLNYVKSDDLIFKGNYAHIFKLSNSNFVEISILECKKIGETSFHNLSTRKDIKIKENTFLKDLSIEKCKSEGELHFRDNKVQNVSLLNTKTNDIRFYDNHIYKSYKINTLKANDIYLIDNQVEENLNIFNAEIDDLIFTRNKAQAFNLYNGNYGEITISECKKIGETNFNNVSASKDIKITDNTFLENLNIVNCKNEKDLKFNNNEIQNFDLINTVANDISLSSNVVKKVVYIYDTKANDIFLLANEVAKDLKNAEQGKNEKNGNESSDNRPAGITLYKCNIESKLLIAGNDTPELLQIKQNLADTLTFLSNKTNFCNISMGKYRQMSINDCVEIGNFSCNNVSIGKDAIFKYNIFQGDFTMLYCKIENDLEFAGNEFKKIHMLKNNTVLGSLIYKPTDIKIMRFRFSPIKVNREFRFNSLRNYNDFYFQESITINTSFFTKALSITENKIKNAAFNNLCFKSPVCLHHNNFEGDLTFRDTAHKMTMDFTSCFVGGSFVFHNTKTRNDNGDLILDNTFVDKRLSFKNYSPASFSFINATFNGFEIPQNWNMHKKKLIKNDVKNKKEYILKENKLQKEKFESTNLPYSLLKSLYESDSFFNEIPTIWKYLQLNIFLNEKKPKILIKSIEQGQEVLNARYYIDQCISKSFLPVYFEWYDKSIIDSLIHLAKYFKDTANTYEDNEASELFDKLKKIFSRFHDALVLFQSYAIWKDSGNKKNGQQIYKHEINNRLEEQYRVLRHIYGSNGELKEEDSAYYKWMHYKNIGEMHSAPLRRKPKNWIKYILYEKIFGWGVDLPRIVGSTLGLVVLFSAIYWVMFQYNPELTIQWDGVVVQASEIGIFRTLVMGLQTTFSAVLGDWAPIGSGSIKIPMTINAVLGVLMVTFMIGAYGRKMLR